MFSQIDKTKIAKKTLNLIVAAKAKEIAEDQLIERTNMEEDSIAVAAISSIAGWTVADLVSPVTDNIVDRAASAFDRFKNRKNDDETPES